MMASEEIIPIRHDDFPAGSGFMKRFDQVLEALSDIFSGGIKA
jgi:hypothetical protein